MTSMTPTKINLATTEDTRTYYYDAETNVFGAPTAAWIMDNDWWPTYIVTIDAHLKAQEIDALFKGLIY